MMRKKDEIAQAIAGAILGTLSEETIEAPFVLSGTDRRISEQRECRPYALSIDRSGISGISVE